MAEELEEIKKMLSLSIGELSGADIGDVDVQKAIFECKMSLLGNIIEEKIVDTDSEDTGSSSSKGEEERNELKKASTIDPPKASKPKNHVGDTSRWNKSRSTTKISSQRKSITTSSRTRPVPLRASRRLAECDPEIAPSMDLEKAPELKTMDDLITSRDHGQKQGGNE
ncbi:hypothetical protein ACH5RR_021607 [Cinchona calisaya]|uniref:Uncharacterized protein n=1 Tax=Cinchona calisaya TaxID=153742 RepID=A0ABD2ZMR3_9GENT